MKKKFFLAMLLITGITQPTFSANHGKGPRGDDPKTAITSLVINANVAIVLVDNADQPVNMIGDPFFMKLVTVKQKGNNLVIAAIKKRDFKSKGIIYISAGSLEDIKINSSVSIRSSGILQSPILKISISGECEVNIRINGKVELIGNDLYDIDYQARQLSDSISKKRKK